MTDHHAIIPTEETPFLQKLQDRERKIYDLIVKRFLAVFLPPYQYEQTTVEASIGSQTFQTKGKRIVEIGWKEVYDFNTERDQLLPKWREGDTFPVLSMKQSEGQTNPPGRFNEGTLLSAMENPKKFMKESNKDLLDTILRQAASVLSPREQILLKSSSIQG